MSTVYVASGKSRDQETIISQRPWMEDFVRENITDFSTTKLFWNMSGDELFDFKLEFYS